MFVCKKRRKGDWNEQRQKRKDDGCYYFIPARVRSARAGPKIVLVSPYLYIYIYLFVCN